LHEKDDTRFIARSPGPLDAGPASVARQVSTYRIRQQTKGGACPHIDFITLPNQTGKPASKNACDDAATMLPAFGAVLRHEFGTENALNSLLDGHRKAEARTEMVAAARNLQVALAVFVGVLERDGGGMGSGLVSATGEVLGAREGGMWGDSWRGTRSKL
jgi:hypothetical protein